MNQKSTDKKMDFIDELLSLSPEQINHMMKTNAKPPKKVRLYHVVDKSKYPTYESCKASGSIFYSIKN